MTTRRALLSTPGGRLAAAVLTAALGAGLGGCQLTSPITTDMQYEPADGISAGVDGVTVSNLLVVSQGEGQPGRVSGLVTNAGTEPATVTVALEDRTELASVEVDPGHSVRLDGKPLISNRAIEPVLIEEVPARPGAFIPIRVGVEGGEAATAQAPILLPEGPYRDLAVDQAGSTAGPDGAGSTAGPDDAESTEDADH